MTKRLDEADLTAQAANAAAFYIQTRCPHGDVYENNERSNDFAKGFYAGVRFYEKYCLNPVVPTVIEE